MNREQVVGGVLALLAVLALGGVAATLDTTVTGDGSGSGEGTDAGAGSSPSFSPGGGFEPIDPPETTLPDWLVSLVALVIVAMALYGTYELYREYGAKRLLAAAAAAIVAMLALYALLSLLGPAEIGTGLGAEAGNPSLSGGSEGGGDDATVRSVPPPTALLVAIGLVLLGAVAVIVRASGDQRVGLDEPTTAESSSPADVAAVAAAAGRAADRIDADADIENAVYRSWHEMTTHLPVENPESSTPAEFADAAVAAGMDRADVTELTRLFEEVRYGDAPVTDERADRATAALRRIERTYGATDRSEAER